MNYPSVNLPKGGGAIRGISEKFTANPATGMGSLSVPIPTSPGRAGFGPELTLSYDSGAGNGPFGAGFSLDLPAIARKTEKGLPQYLDGSESDVFILSGFEDLVPLCDGDGNRFADETTAPGYVIHRYRPRVESPFARIERWTRLDGDVHWRSISRDNVLTVYGFHADSRIADPGDPRRVFSWLICQSYDDNGNAILYEYAEENDDGIDYGQANERNRTRSANRYLKRIRYGNRTPLLFDPERPSFRRSHLEQPDFAAAGWMFEVLFDYGEGHYREEAPDAEGRIFARAATAPAKERDVRRDPFSTYRAAFEIRTYRLCRRVMMFHHFPQELGTDSCLVRSTALAYLEKPSGSFLTRVVQCGHTFRRDGRYLTRSLPPLELSFTPSPLEEPGFDGFTLETVDRESLANLPGGIDDKSYRFVDLDGEGIPGILTEQGEGWFYKANLGNASFGPVQTVQSLPSVASLYGGTQTLMDVAGDGNLDLVELSPQLGGFQERTDDAGWESFRPFRSLPVTEWGDANVRLVDLSGDGVSDLLVARDDAFTWHPSLMQDGFGAGVRVPLPPEEERGARALFADAGQSVYLADMSGDGLSDIVRIGNGEICYWPNLGYGRFGAKVTMDNAPRFDEADQFDQQRIRLADTDGSGTNDIIYLGREAIDIFLNETGNGWSGARRLTGFPGVDDIASVTVTDLLGRGTACLLWSSPLPADAGRPLRYVDLMCGEKPHLLAATANNLGAETRIHYASSTEFYLADKAAGTPWVTRLPFPVQVVKRVESYDYAGRNRFVSSYSYHHGFYDGIEREFRGFGRIDQMDTEELAALTETGDFPPGDNIDAASNVPPVLTKTWFHTGVFLGGERISRHLAHEYYREGTGAGGEAVLSLEQVEAMLLDDTVLPDGLTTEETREACRSLKGGMLRQEIYALDGSEAQSRPYTVTESNYTVRKVQERGDNRYGVFYPHARETVTFNYERKLYEVNTLRHADPRATHEVVLRTDDYGNVLEAAAIGYGRRFPDASLEADERATQARLLVSVTETGFTNAVELPDAYRAPLAARSRLFEVVKAKPALDLPGITNLFRFREAADAVAHAGDGSHDLPFEDWQGAGATGPGPYRRLMQEERTLYRSNLLDALLPLGTLESLALQGDRYRLATTPALLASVYRGLIPDAASVLGSRAPDGGGYVDLDGDGRWWIPNGRAFFHPDPDAGPADERNEAYQHFFLPRRLEDAFGHGSTLDYDPHDFMTVRTVDAVGNTVSIETDYRVLQTRQMTDPNGSRIEALFDTLGMVVATAVKGKVGESAGDLLEDVDPDPPRSVLQAFAADPLGQGAALLGKATTRVLYDLDRFRLTGEPAVAASLARETHFFDPGGATSGFQIALSYSDGFGREIQRKVQAEPGPLQEGGPVADPRWIGSGWTIFNNKGKPVRRYEPFFDDTPAFRFGMTVGVSPVFFYDPLERVVATLRPDHSYEKVVIEPWREASYDVNDTVTFDPGSDPDVAPFFTRLPDDDYLPTWYQLRTDPAFAGEAQARWPDPRDLAAEQEAAQKAAKHADTPALAHFDILRRAFLTVAHNRFERRKPDDSIETVEEAYATRVVFDLEGNQRAVIDANGRVAVQNDFDMLGDRTHEASMEAGERWTLDDVMGQPIRVWDSRGHQFRTAYDELRRHTGSLLRDGDAPEALVERTVYGEELTNPEADNLRGKVVQLFDQAGVISSDSYDFKGNLLKSSRRHATDYHGTLDWSGTVSLEPESYASSTRFDALNRPTEMTTPHSAGMAPSTLRSFYNEGNLLERVEANVNGAAAVTTFVAGIAYDAKGQRTAIDYGNGVRTSYRYDPLTFRLAQLVTRRDAAFPDDCPQPPTAGWPGCQVQNLHYAFDPAGNITRIRDDAQQTIFFRNKRVEPSADYSYDAIYRLIEAAGREHLGQSGGPLPSSYNDKGRIGVLFAASSGEAMGRYLQRYLYDFVGNIEKIVHRGSDPVQPGWTREYRYNEASLLEPGKISNRLSSTTLHPNSNQPVVEPYGYDAHGNMLRMPHLQAMQWDFNDQLQMTRRQAIDADDEDGVEHQGERTFYVYNSAGERVRKVTELASGQVKDERLYLGGLEIYRKPGANGLVRETLHIMDENQRVALVETRTQGSAPGPAQLIRYQFGNHLGSTALELDDQGQVISYEEYYPHGGTSFQAVRSQTETPKRYRYCGLERDEESGLNCHGVRYYAPWLGRWVSADPSGVNGGVNLYSYGANSPVVFVDSSGNKPRTPVTFPIDKRFQKKWGSTQTLPLPGPKPKPKKKSGAEGGGRKMQGSQAGSQAGAEGGAKGGVEGGEEGGVAGGKVGGMGEDPRTGGTPGTGPGGTTPTPVWQTPGTGTDPGTDPGKTEGGGTGTEAGKGKGKAPGGKEGGTAGGGPGGKPGGKAGGKAGGAQDAPPDSKPGNKGDDSLLGDLAALASLITDPESLYNAKKNGNSGKGAQIGHKKGLISGWLGQILVIGMVFMGRIKDAVKGIGGWFKKGYNSIKNKIFGKVEQKALTEALDQEALVKLFGQGADDAEAMLARLEAGEAVAIPEKVTPQMLRQYKAAAEANIEKLQGMSVINKDDAIATQSMRIQIIDILLGRMK